MKAVIQRCKNASVIVEGNIVGKIANGLLVLLGVYEADTKDMAELLSKKVAALRIFSDSENKMNLSVGDIGGSILVVSNFTLCADTKKGNRPSFTLAMEPNGANNMYEYFCDCLNGYGIPVEKGQFGADMEVNMCGDGPITIVLDTDTWKR